MIIRLRKAHLLDFDAFYKLRTDEVNIAWCGYMQAPEKNSFLEWYTNHLNRKDRTIYLAVDEKGNILGYCYLDIITPIRYEISCGVYSSYSGRGIGTQIVKQIAGYAKEAGSREIVAWISTKNYASRKMVEKNGFVETLEKKICKLPMFPDCENFTMWIKKI